MCLVEGPKEYETDRLSDESRREVHRRIRLTGVGTRGGGGWERGVGIVCL